MMPMANGGMDEQHIKRVKQEGNNQQLLAKVRHAALHVLSWVLSMHDAVVWCLFDGRLLVAHIHDGLASNAATPVVVAYSIQHAVCVAALSCTAAATEHWHLAAGVL
jgi:hypothetical protein